MHRGSSWGLGKSLESQMLPRTISAASKCDSLSTSIDLSASVSLLARFAYTFPPRALWAAGSFVRSNLIRT